MDYEKGEKIMTRLNSSNGTEICALLRKYAGDWWFDCAAQRFHRIEKSKITAASIDVREAVNTLLNIFRRMEVEREMVLKMLSHYDKSESIWVLHYSEIENCFDQLYSGCAEPLTDDEILNIINSYKKGVNACLDDWEGILREAIELEAPREMPVESTERIPCPE